MQVYDSRLAQIQARHAHTVNERNNCQVFGKDCQNCGKLNHFKSVCRQQSRGDKQAVSYTEEMKEKSEGSYNSIFVVECISDAKQAGAILV